MCWCWCPCLCQFPLMLHLCLWWWWYFNAHCSLRNCKCAKDYVTINCWVLECKNGFIGLFFCDGVFSWLKTCREFGIFRTTIVILFTFLSFYHGFLLALVVISLCLLALLYIKCINTDVLWQPLSQQPVSVLRSCHWVWLICSRHLLQKVLILVFHFNFRHCLIICSKIGCFVQRHALTWTPISFREIQQILCHLWKLMCSYFYQYVSVQTFIHGMSCYNA